MLSRQGFEWVNEGKTAKLPKWGFIAEAPGAEIKFKVNTNSTAIRRQEVRDTDWVLLHACVGAGGATLIGTWAPGSGPPVG